MLQRFCSKLRFSSIQPNHHHHHHHHQIHRLLHLSSPQIVAHSSAITTTITTRSINLDRYWFLNNTCSPLLRHAFIASSFQQPSSSSSSLFMMQMRNYATKNKVRTKKFRTPLVSKLKKYKIKPYSSFKSRFKTLNDGTIRRWREGKRHNAHSKSKISKRRLRQPALVHPAYATVMKKLNFYG